MSVYLLPRVGRDKGYFVPAVTDGWAVGSVEAANVAVESSADAGYLSEDGEDNP